MNSPIASVLVFDEDGTPKRVSLASLATALRISERARQRRILVLDDSCTRCGARMHGEKYDGGGGRELCRPCALGEARAARKGDCDAARARKKRP